MVNNMDGEFIFGSIRIAIMVTGKMENKTDLELTLIRISLVNLVSGKMESGKSGLMMEKLKNI